MSLSNSFSEKETSNFTVAIKRTDFEKMDEEARNEYIFIKSGEKVLKSRALKGAWINVIAEKINEFEGTKLSMYLKQF